MDPPTDSREGLYGKILDGCIAALQEGRALPSEEEFRALYPDLADRLISKLRVFECLDGPRARAKAREVDPRPQGEPSGFRNLRLLGMGGMGVVYACEEEALRRTVCLKVLPVWMRESAEALARFQREAEVVARLNHPDIVKVFQKGIWGGVPYFTMEYVKGDSLAAALKARQQDPSFAKDRPEYVRRSLQEIHAVCLAVHEAHEHGVIHRDLKPSNLVYDGARLRVLDFGLALDQSAGTFTQGSHVMGSLPYMSPEQLIPLPQDCRTDIYSLGATLFEVLTFRTPFSASTSPRLKEMILSDPPARMRALNPAVSADVEAIVEKCLEKERTRRYSTMLDMAADLERSVSGQTVTARRVSPITRGLRWARRRRIPLGVASGTAALLVALILSVQAILRFYVWKEEVRFRIDAAIRASRVLPDSPPDEAVEELVRLLPSAGDQKREVLRTLAAIAHFGYHFEEASILLEHAGPLESTEVPLRWPLDHFLVDSLFQSVCRRAPSRDSALRLLESIAKAGEPQSQKARAALLVDEKLGGPPVSVPSPGPCSAATWWDPGDGQAGRLVVAVAPERDKAGLAVLDFLLDPPRLRLMDFGDAGFAPQRILVLVPADLDRDQRQELWVFCSMKTGRAVSTQDLQILRVLPSGKRYEATEYYEYQQEGVEVSTNAVCAAEIPCGTGASTERGLLVGTRGRGAALCFFPWREGGALEPEFLYQPGRRLQPKGAPSGEPDADVQGDPSTSPDVDSLAVVDLGTKRGPPRIVVSFGNWNAHRTMVLAFDAAVGQYLPEWETPLGGALGCCAIAVHGATAPNAVLLGNGGAVLNPEVFGPSNPLGPKKGIYLLDFSGVAPDFRLLEPHSGAVSITTLQMACGTWWRDGETILVAGCVGAITGALSSSLVSAAGSPGASEQGNPRVPPESDVRLFVLGKDSLAQVLFSPAGGFQGAVFADLDRDGSDELVLYGRELVVHGLYHR